MELCKLFACFYAPISGHDDDFIEALSELTYFLNSNTDANDQIFIGTDSNVSKKSSTRRQYAWDEFCSSNHLVCHRPPEPTFHHHNGLSESCLDMFIASSCLQLHNIYQICTLNEPLNLSSHDVITCNLSLKTEILMQGGKFRHTYSNFNRQKIIWDRRKFNQYQNLVELFLPRAISYWNSAETLPHLISLVSKLFVNAAAQTFKTSSFMHHIPKKTSRQVLQAQKKLEHYFKQWKSDGRPTSPQSTSWHK